MNSMRAELAARGLTASSGLRVMHPAFGRDARIVPARSLRQLLASLRWPSRLAPTGANYDFPRDREPGWSSDVQGVTHDADTWFITQERVMWMFPVEWSLNDSIYRDIAPMLGGHGSCSGVDRGLGIAPELADQGYAHLGDCDYWDGRVYIPVENKNGLAPLVVAPRVSRQGALCSPADVAPLVGQKEAPWCAVSPLNGLLFSSNFDVDHDGLFVHRLEPSFGGIKLTVLGRFELRDPSGAPISLQRIQGGTFSPQGHLYLVSDAGTQGGLLGFDTLTGRLMTHLVVDYKPELDFGPVNPAIDIFTDQRPHGREELEGVTYWDLEDGRAPGILGQIHLLMIDNVGSGADDLYFKHYRVF